MTCRFLILVSVLINIFAPPSCYACDSGWFGNGCQYKCHCDGDAECDDETGDCPDGRCDPAWFGPACQYESSTYVTYGADWLLQDSCNDGSDQTVTIALNTHHPITWFRVVANDQVGANTDELDVSYQNELGEIVVCLSDQRAKIDNVTLDVSCPTAESVAIVTLSGTDVTKLCSLYISGGRNVALLAPGYTVDQINTYNSEDGWGPENAVDGEAPPGTDSYEVRSDGCSQTQSTPEPWWEISFGDKNFYINRFVIYSRRDPGLNDRLAGFLLTAFYEGSEVYLYQDSHTTGLDIYDIVPETRIESPVDKVVISSEKTVYFELCEVIIYGDSACEAGEYGRECENHCNCVDNDACFVSTGGCPSGCNLGYTGEDCLHECTDAFYGQDCTGTCSEHCAGEDNSCDHVDGSCDQGCEPGYQSTTCTEECTKGFYGQNCTEVCNEHCAGEDNSCDHVDGSCDQGCEPGYQSETCTEECPDGHYGQDCTEACSDHCAGEDNSCDHVDGSCDQGCDPGYQSATCTDECPDGSYGQECTEACSEHCAGEDKSCDRVDGSCDQGCDPGYQSATCSNECLNGSYGQNCTETCSEHCAGEDNSCDHVDGSCDQGCDIGYESPTCKDECPDGTYGHDCAEACSEHCAGENNSCDHVDGSCDQGCDPGYQSATCKEECTKGLYGQDCTETCSEHCAGEDISCDHVDGSCDQGCEPGYESTTCEEVASQASAEGDSTLMVIAVVVGVLIVCAVIAGAYAWRRKRSKTESKDTTKEAVDGQHDKDSIRLTPLKSV